MARPRRKVCAGARSQKDAKGRNLKDGELQQTGGRFKHQYMDSNGKRKAVYSWHLLPTDRIPPGTREDLSLRTCIHNLKTTFRRVFSRHISGTFLAYTQVCLRKFASPGGKIPPSAIFGCEYRF